MTYIQYFQLWKISVHVDKCTQWQIDKKVGSSTLYLS